MIALSLATVETKPSGAHETGCFIVKTEMAMG
jgi:hypothetical protein